MFMYSLTSKYLHLLTTHIIISIGPSVLGRKQEFDPIFKTLFNFHSHGDISSEGNFHITNC